MLMYIITVRLPNGGKTFQTRRFTIREGRVLFEDKFGQPKNFPENDCFIEGVEQWMRKWKKLFLEDIQNIT